MTSARFTSLVLALAGLAAVLFSPSSRANDPIFSNSFEVPFNSPANDGEAARFLNQATFGATAADITAVRNQSISTWLSAQLNLGTVTLSRPWLEAYTASLATGGVSQDVRVQRWYDVAVNAPDQVRQRVAWALSQFVVASDRDAFLIDQEIMMAEWNDILVRNALGNYRDLLREVSYSPMMGRYLTSLRNQRFLLLNSNGTYTAGNNGVQPDENYAREIMQLFSIGLLVRGKDFYTTFPDEQNPDLRKTTYNEDDIANLARVFTGLSHTCTQGASTAGGVTFNRNCGANDATACTGVGCRFGQGGSRLFNTSNIIADPIADRGLIHPDFYRPMVCYPAFHDTGRDNQGGQLPDPESTLVNLPPGSPGPNKRLVLGAVGGDRTLELIPSFDGLATLNCAAANLTPQQQQACVSYCEGGIDQAIDFLFNHPNTPPMVARQLIQRLVTSNPTPGYVERVADAFINNGSGVRGDMKSVVSAILLDVEARRPASHPEQPVNFGKVREPMLKMVALWRHFGARSGDTANIPATNPRGGQANPLAGQPSLRRWGPNNPQDIFQQRPHGAPSVFNFYEPDYKQPGAVATLGLFSPELQIVHEVSAVSVANELFTRICSGYGGNDCGNTFTLPTDRSYFPTAQIDAMPAVVPANANLASATLAQDMELINFFNVRMMGGTMSGADLTSSFNCLNSEPGMKWRLMNALRCGGGLNENLNGGTNGTTNGTQAERKRRKALFMMHLIAISPEYSTQR